MAQTDAVRRSMVPEDLYELQFISDPQVSPDGRRVAYVVTAIEREADDYRAHIWVAHADGSGEPAQFTRGAKKDTAPRWSPDGSCLAFLSDRHERNQIWLIDADGGEARQLTTLAEPAAGIAWSPDGRRLAFTSRVGPPKPDATEAEPGKKKADEPQTIVVRTLKHKQDGEGFRLDRWRHVFVVGTDGGEPRRLTEGDFDHDQPTWSPDGRQIAFTCGRTQTRDYDNVTDVYIVPAEGGEARRLTASRGPAGEPVFSPDGRWLAYRGHDNHEPAGHAASTRLWLVPAAGGEPRCLTAAWDVNLGSGVTSDMRAGAGPQPPIWAPDGRSITVIAHEHGDSNLYRCDVASGRVTPLTEGDQDLLSVSASADGAVLAWAASDAADPGDVFSADANGNGVCRLTRLNEAFLSSRSIARPERIAYQGEDGHPLEGWLLLPAGYAERRARGERFPLVLEIHGGPHAMYGNAFFHEFQILAGQGYVVLYTNPRGSQGYGEHHSACIKGDWGGTDYRDLMAAVDYTVGREAIDTDRLGVLGGSYGGYMTNWIVGQTARFAAAVTMRCVSNWYSMYGSSDIGPFMGDFEYLGPPWEQTQLYLERSPITHVANITTPLLILHSDNDLRCPIEQAEQMFTSLCRLGREVEYVRFPGQNHNLSRSGRPRFRVERLHRLLDWFAPRLRPSTTSAEPVAATADD